MFRVVLDTNVIVSAVLKPDGNEGRTLRLGFAQKFHLLVSVPMLAEYEGVLRRPRLRLSTHEVSETLRRIREVATWIEPHRTLEVSHDEADNRFLECAEAGAANYLVTGNKKHFPATWGKTHIVNARRLVELLAPKP